MILIEDVIKLYVEVGDVQLILTRYVEESSIRSGKEGQQVRSNGAELAIVAVPEDLVALGLALFLVTR